MKKFLALAAIVALLLGGAGRCQAQDTAKSGSSADLKPLLLISFAGYDVLKQDIDYAGKISNNPNLSAGLEFMLGMVTQGRGLNGIDRGRPWGAAIFVDEKKVNEGASQPQEILSGYVFIPVKDFDQIVQTVKLLDPGAKEEPKGALTIQTPQTPIYLKHAGDWAYVSGKAEVLAHLPANPETVLSGLNKEYDLAFRLIVANVPEKYREFAIGTLSGGIQGQLSQKPGETESQFAVRKALAERSLEAAKSAINDLDRITVGWKLDTEKETAHFDIAVAAKAGTKAAADYAAASNAATEFAGLLPPKAAIRANWTSKVTSTQQAEWDMLIKALRQQALEGIDKEPKSEEERKLGKDFVGDLLDVVLATIKAGRVDAGLSVSMEPKSVSVLAGGYIADGDKLDKAARKLAEAATQQNPVIGQFIKLDADKQGDIHFHEVTIPIDPNDPKSERMNQFLGESIHFVLAIGKSSVYVALGRDPMASVKESIAKSKSAGTKSVDPFEIAVAVRPLAEFIAQVAEGKQKEQAALVAKSLATSDGNDHVRLVVQPVTRGLRVRVQVEKGILRAIGTVAAERGGNKSP